MMMINARLQVLSLVTAGVVKNFGWKRNSMINYNIGFEARKKTF